MPDLSTLSFSSYHIVPGHLPGATRSNAPASLKRWDKSRDTVSKNIWVAPLDAEGIRGLVEKNNRGFCTRPVYVVWPRAGVAPEPGSLSPEGGGLLSNYRKKRGASMRSSNETKRSLN